MNAKVFTPVQREMLKQKKKKNLPFLNQLPFLKQLPFLNQPIYRIYWASEVLGGASLRKRT